MIHDLSFIFISKPILRDLMFAQYYKDLGEKIMINLEN